MTDLEELTAQLKVSEALRDGDTIKTGTIERIEPEYAAGWPETLAPSIQVALANIGLPQPYRHQAEAVIRSLDGADVVLESPTASGKTMAFTIPMLDALIRYPNSHALMIYPMKALAFDQREQIRQVCESLSIQSWPYDGDTDAESKRILRTTPPQILLTNPEYLNMSFMGWREKWDDFLRHLQYVVVDEMHEYRGFFGSNMALLLRRFLLYLHRLGVSPRIFLSTATCANPAEHARNLTGRDDIQVVSARDVFRPRRHFMFVRPAIPEFKYRDILQVRVEQAALTMLSGSVRVLVFCPTKRFLESVFINTRRKATDRGLNPDRISMFHADLRNEDRQDIQQRIRAGNIDVVFTTNALELGLDIGALDGIILAGFPSSIMSAWQQIGRAGRGWDKDAVVLFYAMNDPIDQFFAGNVHAFLNKPFDQLVIDASNDQLIENHMASLVEETGGQVHPGERAILGSAFWNAAKEEASKPAKGFKPQPYLNLRGGIGKSFILKHETREVGQISAFRRFREAYIGAIFTFFGQRYRVRSHEEDAVVLANAEPNLKTEAGFYTVLFPKAPFDGFAYGDVEVYHGPLDMITNFTGYKLIDDHGELRETGGIPDAYPQNKLHAFWINVPQGELARTGVGALEHMFRVGAMFVIPADRFDTSTYSRVDEPAVFYYENYSGGIGVAKKLFEVWPEALSKGVEIARACECVSGCPNCIEPAKSYDISNADVDKVRGIELAETLLNAARGAPDRRFRSGRMAPM